MTDRFVLGPLSEPDKDLAQQVAAAAENALASRSPALLAEVMANLLVGVMYDHRDRPGADVFLAGLMQHVVLRADGLAHEALAGAIVAKHVGQL